MVVVDMENQNALVRIARKISGFWQESVVELRKVVWPTKQETIQSTVAVLAMVFVMSLVLWSIDAVLVRVVAWIIRQGAV
jgi:preprotein translocase subunit SecE